MAVRIDPDAAACASADSRTARPGRPPAGAEVTILVEDAVIGQIVLEAQRRDPALLEQQAASTSPPPRREPATVG